MKVFLGADHGGYEHKEAVKKALQVLHPDWVIEDIGASTMDPADDYPEFALGVAEGVAQEAGSLGVVFCRSAGGAIIAANKVKGVRAVAAQTEDQAVHARQHNDAQVLGIGGDVVTQDAAVKIVEKFVTTPFTNEERHTRRLQKIAAYEDTHE